MSSTTLQVEGSTCTVKGGGTACARLDMQRPRYFVGVASAAGLLTHIGGAAYAATKHAAVGFAEWLAITYADQGIGVSCVCPMGVDTQC